MPEQPTLRTEEDLQRVIRALAREFKTDTVFIIGSQAILMSWPDPPSIMLMTPEIDAYPANARVWEIAEEERDDGIPREASEHIDGLFGEGSPFHRALAQRYPSIVFMGRWVSQRAHYLQSHPAVKNFVPSKNRFGRLNTEMNVAPFGACATWMLPPGHHTKSPAPQAPSASSSDPSSM